MAADTSDTSHPLAWEEREVNAAAEEAARIGGRAGDEYLDPAERPLVEAGEGVAEGFELAEEELIEAAETAARWADPRWNAFASEVESRQSSAEYSEADHEDSSELLEDDR
jgi:hypothetical protein